MQIFPVKFTKYLLSILVLLTLLSQENLFAFQQDSLKHNQTIVVDSIRITGNDKTKDFIILRELNFQIGDTISQTRLHYNRERVFSLGLFNRVEVFIMTHEEYHTILIDVEETWYIYPIPFWYVEKSSLDNSTVGLNLVWKNFRGRNATLRSSIGIGYDSFVSVQYDNPALFFDSGIGFTFGFGYSKTSNRNEEAKRIVGKDFNYKIIKGNVGFYQRIDQYNMVGISVGYDNWQLGIIPESKLTASGTSVDNYPWISTYYSYDSRDLKQFSQNGLLVNGNLLHKGFNIKGSNYNIAEIDLRMYRRLIGDFTSKWRTKYRQAFGGNVPFYDYSFLGYSDKIRGHSDDYVEGENSLLTSVEFSYPIIKEWNVSFDLPLVPTSLTSARIAMFVHAFADAGTTFNNGDPLFLNRFNSGYGLGLTFLILPFNAIRFEYAINELGKGEFLFATGFSF
jgi:outer membrane protein assembly factor BamA